MRFLDGEGRDWIPRAAGVFDTGRLIARAVSALLAADQELPAWLDTLAQETSSGEVETALFAMF